MAEKSKEEKYTKPKLREEIKEEIQASDKGGKPGQWSARKSQLLAQEYEKRGGGYRGEKDESQKDLEEWTDEEWQMKEGGADAREDGETRRYLPKKAWENMSEEEKDETEKRKRKGSRAGEQYVPNTKEAKRARKEAAEGNEPIEGYDDMNVEDVKKSAKDLSEGELS